MMSAIDTQVLKVELQAAFRCITVHFIHIVSVTRGYIIIH